MRDIIRGIEQGSEAWQQLRLGIPTASAFDRILTAKKLEPSAQQEMYMAELNAEWRSGEPCDGFGGTEWVERGKALEPEARKYYAFKTQQDPKQVAFIYKDEQHMVGCSPDALVGDEGLLELKCPMLKTHMFWLNRSTLPREHLIQVQGQIWVAGATWCDFMSYFPDEPPVLFRIYPELPVQAAFDKHIPAFLSGLVESRKRLEAKGCIPARIADPHWIEECESIPPEMQKDAPIPERDEPPAFKSDTVDAGIMSTLYFKANIKGIYPPRVDDYVKKYYGTKHLTIPQMLEVQAWIEGH